MKSIGYISSQKRNSLMVVLYFVAAAGITVGAVYQVIKSPEPSAWIHQYFAPVYTGTDMFDYMCRWFGVSVFFLTAAFFSGFFALGQPLVFMLMLCRGFGVGAAGAAMYTLHGGHAAAGMLIFVLPKAVPAIMIYSLAVREALRASSYTLSGWTPEGFREYERSDIKFYCIKFLVLVILSLIISAADAVVNFIFAG